MTTPLPIAQFIGPRPEPGVRPTISMPDRASGFADRLDAARARLAETAQQPDPTKTDRRSPEPAIASDRPSTSGAHDARSTERGLSGRAEARDRSATETNADSTAAGGDRSSIENDVAGGDSVEPRSKPAADGDGAESSATDNGADATGTELENVGDAVERLDENPEAIPANEDGAATAAAVGADRAIDHAADDSVDSTAAGDTAASVDDATGANAEHPATEKPGNVHSAADNAAVGDSAVEDAAAGGSAVEDAAGGDSAVEDAAGGDSAVGDSAVGDSVAAEERPVSESATASDTAADTADRDDDGATEVGPEQAAAQAAALGNVAAPQPAPASASSETTADEPAPDDAVAEANTGTSDGEVAMSAEASQAPVIRPGGGTDGPGGETGDGDRSSRATSEPNLSSRPVTSSGSAAADTMSMPTPPVGPAAESSSSPLVTSTATTLLGDDVEAQLWDQVQQALGRVRASENGQELRMRLRPADLGELLIQVHTRGDHVSVRLATTNDGARQALLDDQARLAEELANAGFQGASVDVRQENDGGDRSERDEAGPVRFDRADTLPPTRRREAILRHHRRSSIELTL